MPVSLSNTSKLGCFSWSLQALETCPGSIGDNGELVEVCQGCYATAGNYRFPNVKRIRQQNKESFLEESWTTDMALALSSQRFFRWFDSGDMFSLSLAEKIYQVCLDTPWCFHWIPTRMYKFDKFKPIIDKLNALPNVVVRFSGDNIGQSPAGAFVSKVVDSYAQEAGVHLCPSSQQEGKCLSCRACWSKDVHNVAYVAHGKKMSKVIRLKEVV
jgi:Gene product 88